MGGLGREREEGIVRLVTEATSCDQHRGVPLRYIQEIKRVGKTSNDAIRVLFEALLLRLNERNSEIRLCALELWQVLFERSAAFRKLGCCKFDVFIRRVVGRKTSGRSDLPGPTAAADELRRQGLRLLQEWHERYGHVLPRLRLAYRYVRSLPGIEFPRHERHGSPSVEDSRDDRGRRSTSPERDGVSARVVQALADFSSIMERGTVLVRELEHTRSIDGMSPRLPPSTVEEEEEEIRGEDEEDVEEIHGEEEEEEDVWEDVDGDASPELSAGIVSVQLANVYHEASSGAIPKLQEIINTCRESMDRPRVREVMDKAIELNAALVTACARYETYIGQHARDIIEKERMNQEVHEDNHREDGDNHRGGCGKEEKKVPLLDNPMQRIRDPTAPRVRAPSAHSNSIRSVTHQDRLHMSSMETNVLQKLASVAPVVPTTGFARVWDSNAPPVYAGSHSMEVANHWGPVDVHQELPKDRLDTLFLIDQSKVRYKGDGQPRSTLRDDIKAPCGESNSIKGHTTHMSTVQKDVLATSASGRDARRAEKLYNEDVLRQANTLPGEHLRFLDNLPHRREGETSSQPSGATSKKRRTMSVQERLAKKLFIKRRT